ncbi:hypothetical protein B1R94_25945 [Mycolicibacterium litorale]|nr:hypothetical protein B1R94_25945 [Mycolicibacterium litorale]
MSRFTTDLEAELKRVQATVEVAARIGHIDDAELDAWRARQEADAVTVRVETDTSQIDRAVAELSRSVGGGSTGGIGSFSPGGLLLGLSPALIDPVIASVGVLSTSIVQLAEAGLVLPGAIGGGVAALLTAKVGVNGLEDAYKALDKAQDGTAKSAYEAEQAMGKLAPSARDFLSTFMDVKREFLDDNGIQENLFSQVGTSLRDAAAKELPILKTGMESIASGLNSNIRALLDSVGSSQGQGLLQRILGNTSEAQARFSAAIDPIVRGVGTLVAAGSDELPRIADAIAGVTERIATALEKADQDGSLKAAMDEGIEALGHAFDIAKNLGDAFVSIARAAGGEGLLGTLDQLTGRFADWLKTAEGQREVRRWFDDAKEAAGKWLPILGDLPGLLQGIIEGGRSIGDVVVPVFSTISGFLSDYPNLTRDVVAAFALWQGMEGVTALVASLTKVSTMLSGELPAAARTGATGVSTALAGITAPAWLITLLAGGSKVASDAFNEWSDAHPEVQRRDDQGRIIPGRESQNGGRDPGLYTGRAFGDQGPGANAQRERRGAPPVDPNMWGGGGGFATGGYTDWPASEGVHAVLHGKEFVQQADAVAKYGVPFMSALNEGRIDPRSLPHYDTGGYVDPYGNPVVAGPAPGPQQASGGLMSAFGSFLSGLQGPLNLGAGLGSGLLNQVPGVPSLDGADSAAGPFNGFSNRTASIPGLIGLFGGLGGENPAGDLMRWGVNTGQWLGQFTANTGAAFGTALWQGLLGMVGLDNSFLSPTNPYNRDLMQGLGYYGDLSGDTLGRGKSGSGRQQGATAKQIREAMDRISDRDSQVAIAEARLRELPPYASESQRLSAQSAVDKANREAAEARLDLESLQQGGGTVLSSSRSSLHGAVSPAGGSGAERWRPVVMQALSELGPDRGITNYQGWADALLGQIRFESNGDPNALNPNDSDGLPAIGLSQFKQGTFNAHNVLGGDIHDPVASIYAMIDYVNSRYGQNSAGVPNFINQGHGYATGGAPKGIGGPTSDLIPAWLSANEHVFTAWEVDAMGGQDAVYAFRAGLHANAVKGYADAGQAYLTPAQQQAWQNAMQNVPTPPTPPRPNLDPGPGVQQKIVPPPPPPSPPPPGPPAAPGMGSAAIAAAPTTTDATPGYRQGPTTGFQLNAPAPSSYDHNLPAINTAIQSTATTLGNIAATAASMGMGAAGAAGAPGAGAASGLVSSAIQGGAQQAGKIAKNVANVFSSFGVGNITMGDPTAPVYGTPAISAQRQPDTMPSRFGVDRPLSFYGMQPRDVIREIRTMDAEDSQGSFATL